MSTLVPNWNSLGPFPTNAILEEKLMTTKHKNNNERAREDVWIARSNKNTELNAKSDEDFFLHLDNCGV